MGKYDTWSLECEICNWKWETCSLDIAKKPICPQCNSNKCRVKKNKRLTIKRQGKIITDLEIKDKYYENSNILEGDILFSKYQPNKPLVVIKENDFNFNDEITNEQRKEICKKIDDIKEKLIRDIIDNQDQN